MPPKKEPPPAEPASRAPEATPGRPICPFCDVPCVATSSPAFFTYYACPHDDCQFTTKVVRRRALQNQRGEEVDPPR